MAKREDAFSRIVPVPKLGIVILTSAEHPANALVPTDSKPSGNVSAITFSPFNNVFTYASSEQLLNAYPPIPISDTGRSIPFKELQPANA